MRKIWLALGALAALFSISTADAQTVSKQPQFAAANAWTDVGNGPTEVLAVQGSGVLYSSFASGTGGTSGSSTSVTLNSTTTNPPCVGCIISGTGITTGTTVTATNGTTGITLSAAMTVATPTTLSWGVACPTSGFPATPAAPPLSPALEMRASAGVSGGLAIPLYTQARICAYGGQQAGLTFVNFAIGAW